MNEIYDLLARRIENLEREIRQTRITEPLKDTVFRLRRYLADVPSGAATTITKGEWIGTSPTLLSTWLVTIQAWHSTHYASRLYAVSMARSSTNVVSLASQLAASVSVFTLQAYQNTSNNRIALEVTQTNSGGTAVPITLTAELLGMPYEDDLIYFKWLPPTA